MKKLFLRVGRFFLVALAVLVIGGTMADPVSGRGGGGGGRGGGGRGGGGRGGGGRGGGGGARGMGGGRGGGKSGTGGVTDRRQVAQDLEDRRLQEEKEERIRESRQLGAEDAYDDLQERVLDAERERMSEERRQDWRDRANPA